MTGLDEVKKMLPDDAGIQEACYEASDIVFYTRNKDFFLDNEDVIKQIVSKLKKRVEVRPAQNIRKEASQAKEVIKDLVPDEAGLGQIHFQPSFGKVIIEAKKPGLVIGKSGKTLNKIKSQTKWMPEVNRIPAIDSKVVERAREIIQEGSEFRKDFLNDIGKKIQLNKTIGDEWIRITGLGSCRQVGRSSFLLQTEESNVMLDCGINPSGEDRDAYPILNVPELDLKALDAVIITHAHLDHCGFLPYLFAYGYDGPVYCTEPTRDLMILLQLDYLDVLHREGRSSPYDSTHIKEEIKRTIPLSYGEVADITPDMRLTFNNAGHILGSASAHLHIGEGLHNIVYTGDIKYDKSELLRPADPKFNRVETLIMESTYGDNDNKRVPRKKSNKEFKKMVRETIKNDGHVIIPAFAVGRSQEVMMLLGEEAEKDYFDVPVYLDGMIWDATALHTAYPEYLSNKIQNKIFNDETNPFLHECFERVGGQEERIEAVKEDSNVILATSGMISGGPIMYYLDELAEDKNNRLIFVGYQAKGTYGNKIQSGANKVTFPGNDKPTRMNLDIKTAKGFSGHSTKQQLINYVSNLPNKPKKILTNHGDSNATFRLSSTLHKMFKINTTSPRNLETIRLD